MTIKPNWTVLYNENNGEFIGTHWAFFINKDDAQKYFDALNSDFQCGTIRPYHKNDEIHLGAYHKS